MELHSVANSAHCVLANTEMEIASRAVSRRVIARTLDISLGGRRKVSRSAHDIRNRRRKFVEDNSARIAGSVGFLAFCPKRVVVNKVGKLALQSGLEQFVIFGIL